MALASLIDKQDTFEIVRDQIAAILVAEVANQKALAEAASKDPKLWDLKVYTERANAWEQYLHEGLIDRTPIVNVWVDNGNFQGGRGDTINRQENEMVYNVDVYGFGISENNPAGGHKAGDQEAAFEAQRAARLVRNILMAAENAYLNLRGTVGQRWPQSLAFFQPQLNDQAVQHVVGGRFALRVRMNEFSPQVASEVLEQVHIDVKRTEDGQIVLEADYTYPLP